MSKVSASLSSEKDDFKPRANDWILALICPGVVYFYCWRRARLPASHLHDFCWLYMVSGMVFVAVTLPEAVLSAWLAYHDTSDDGVSRFFNDLQSKSVLWKIIGYAGWSWLVPHFMLSVLAYKAWLRARRITNYHKERLMAPFLRQPVPPTHPELEVVEGEGVVNRDFSYYMEYLKSSMDIERVNLDEAMRENRLDDFSREWLEEQVFYVCPSMIFCMFGSGRAGTSMLQFIGIFIPCILETTLYLLYRYIAVIVAGYPVVLVYLRSVNDQSTGIGVYRQVALGAVMWGALPLILCGVAMFLAHHGYYVMKQTGVRFKPGK